MKKFITGKIRAADLAKLKHRCAWDGCGERTASLDLPPDWRWLLLYWSPSTANLNPFSPGIDHDRDAALCPKHWRELDGLLIDIGNRLRETQGSA